MFQVIILFCTSERDRIWSSLFRIVRYRAGYLEFVHYVDLEKTSCSIIRWEFDKGQEKISKHNIEMSGILI